jgi:hypothetical protein
MGDSDEGGNTIEGAAAFAVFESTELSADPTSRRLLRQP